MTHLIGCKKIFKLTTFPAFGFFFFYFLLGKMAVILFFFAAVVSGAFVKHVDPKGRTSWTGPRARGPFRMDVKALLRESEPARQQFAQATAKKPKASKGEFCFVFVFVFFPFNQTFH